MRNDFYLTKRLPPYVFKEMNLLKEEAEKNNQEIIDLALGNPDTPPSQNIIDKLISSINSKSHGYSDYRGITELRKAISCYYKNRFSVDIDYKEEAIVTMGSKEGLTSLAMGIISPNDTVMIPNPSYPTHIYGFMIAGANIWHLPNFINEVGLINQIKRVVQHCSPKPIALVLNFPGNPTAETVTLDFYEEVVNYCIKEEIYIISDLAYSEIYFDESKPPPSILQVNGAKDICIEFTTLSKTYSMAGWRVGFAVGNRTLISALSTVKSYQNYGSFIPIQMAAVEALTGPQEHLKELRKMYKHRRDVLIKGLENAGWDNISKPMASMFLWTRIPEKYRHLGSFEFAKLLLEKASVFVSPGIGFGKYGEGYIRIGLVQNEEQLLKACENIKKFLE